MRLLLCEVPSFMLGRRGCVWSAASVAECYPEWWIGSGHNEQVMRLRDRLISYPRVTTHPMRTTYPE